MYWKKGDEESFWMEEEDTILHLKGYFVYYEKIMKCKIIC